MNHRAQYCFLQASNRPIKLAQRLQDGPWARYRQAPRTWWEVRGAVFLFLVLSGEI
jgi:hypothetical protein